MIYRDIEMTDYLIKKAIHKELKKKLKKKPRNKRLVIIDKPKKTTAHLLMPDVISKLVHDFIRPPDKNKINMDWVIMEIRIIGDEARFQNMDYSLCWGRWVCGWDEWDWDLMVSNCIAPAWLIEQEGQHIQDEFLGMGISGLMLIGIDNRR